MAAQEYGVAKMKVVSSELANRRRDKRVEAPLIDIEIDLLQRFGIPATPALYDADAEVGEVAYRDGRFTFNGQPLQDQAQAELAARCRAVIRPGAL